MFQSLLLAASIALQTPHGSVPPPAIIRVAENTLTFEQGSPSAVAYNMVRRAIDPSVSEAERKGDRKTYFSDDLQKFQQRMTDDQWRGFDADDITGTQDYSAFKVKSVVQGMYGRDIEVLVTFDVGAKDDAGKPMEAKVGYDMKQNTEGEWKVDDIVYHDGDKVKTFRETVGTLASGGDGSDASGSFKLGPASARCRIVLRRRVPVCPAVTYGPDDCTDQMTGRTGEVIASEGMLNKMSSGHTYFCVSHSGCYETKNVIITGCAFQDAPSGGSSKEYLKEVIVH